MALFLALNILFVYIHIHEFHIHKNIHTHHIHFAIPCTISIPSTLVLVPLTANSTALLVVPSRS